MIKVKFFASLYDIVKSREVELEANGITIPELKVELEARYSGLNLQHCMVSINEEYASESDVVAAGDVVAFIPPVSGG